jgi:hypothetical protein
MNEAEEGGFGATGATGPGADPDSGGESSLRVPYLEEAPGVAWRPLN